jgi:hypothetical protein
VTMISRPLTRCRCKALMLSLDGVVMIHKRGAIVSRSGEHRSSSRNDLIRGRLLRAIEGWLGKEPSCSAPGAGVRSRTSSVALENGGMAARGMALLQKSLLARLAGEALMCSKQRWPAPGGSASLHTSTRRRQTAVSRLPSRMALQPCASA